jgi:hypothetical protein
MRKVRTCTHLNSVRQVTPSGEGCVECCDDSKNRHARKHSAGTGHPIVSSFEPGEDWSWCFIDDMEVVLP